MKHVLKTLIDDGIVDFRALVLKYYHRLDLSESEAVALIKLHDLLEEQQQIIKPSKFAKWLALSERQTEKTLEGLIEKGYLSISLVEDEDGRERESFDVDHFLFKVVSLIESKATKGNEDTLAKTVEFLEKTLNRPLRALDLELVEKWINEEGYSFEMVEAAALESLKKKKPSLQEVDRVLYNEQKRVGGTSPSKSEALKEFHKLWDE